MDLAKLDCTVHLRLYKKFGLMRSGIKKIIQEFLGVIKGISKRIFRSTFNERGRLRYYEVRSLYLMFHRAVYSKTY